MQTVNQIFMQLREVDKYARAKNPHLRRLAVVLLDNIVEIQLYRKSDTALAMDQTTWLFGVRKHNKEQRKSVGRYHRPMVQFAMKQGWITEVDANVLEYAHRVRNTSYHKGEHKELDAELAIRLLYRFIKKYFPDWRNGWPGLMLSPYPAIGIESAERDSGGLRPLLLNGTARNFDFDHAVMTEKYWKKALRLIMRYRPKGDIRALIQTRINEVLDRVDYSLNQINENRMDYNWVLGERFAVMTPAFTHFITQGKQITNPNAAINIYLAVREAEEALLDVIDPAEREKKFFDHVKQHKFVKEPISVKRLEEYREQADKVLTRAEDAGIALLLRIEEELRIVGDAVYQFASDIELWAERELNFRRGK